MTHRAAADYELVQRFVGGDTDAFSELMEAHEDRVFGICLRMLRDREAALDATQETFITVFRKVDGFAGKSAFSTWLYRVAVNTCYDALRRGKRRRTEPLPEERVVMDPGAAAELESAEDRPAIEAALARLSVEFRTAVVLVDMEGLAIGTAAELLGVPPGTVKSRVFRGRRQLAEILGNQAAPFPPPSGEGA